MCVYVTVQAEELGVGPHTYTFASSQAFCVCVLFMPLLRRCAVLNNGRIWAALLPEAARLAATADQSSQCGGAGTPQHVPGFSGERLSAFELHL